MNNLTDIDQQIKLACDVRQRAYAPYSDFKVGAAIMTLDGEVFVGCNVENSVFGLSICAERVALAQAITNGKQKFQRIVIAASPLASPCGSCRQLIAEFVDASFEFISVDAEDTEHRQTWKMSELLPHKFSWEGEAPAEPH